MVYYIDTYTITIISEEIDKIELGVLEAKALMKTKKIVKKIQTIHSISENFFL